MDAWSSHLQLRFLVHIVHEPFDSHVQTNAWHMGEQEHACKASKAGEVKRREAAEYSVFHCMGWAGGAIFYVVLCALYKILINVHGMARIREPKYLIVKARVLMYRGT